MHPLAPFNSLPPRPEYINKVMKVLKANSKLSRFSIQKRTNLTQTQVACTLEKLVSDGEIIAVKEKDKLLFEIAN